MSRTLNLGLGAPADALDRFEAAWHFAADGKLPAAVHLLSFADLPLLLRTLTAARWRLLEHLAAAGPLSVYALARQLERDYKNVYVEVKVLTELGLIELGEDARIAVPWDAVRAQLKLHPRKESR